MADRPNPREISNAVSQQTGDTPSPEGVSDLLWAWGQFIDHDLSLTEAGETEFQPIIAPIDDPVFTPTDGVPAILPFTRVTPIEGTGEDGPRQYENELTAFLDASMVYGSDDATAEALRADGGYMLLDEQGLLPRLKAAPEPEQALQQAQAQPQSSRQFLEGLRQEFGEVEGFDEAMHNDVVARMDAGDPSLEGKTCPFLEEQGIEGPPQNRRKR